MPLAVTFVPTEEGPITSYELAPDPRLAKDEGILCIGSGPWDGMRLSWLQRQLFSNLSELGYHVTRFDFCGTGDSQEPTDAADWERWVRECMAMRENLRKSKRRIHVVGFRLGAALALKASETYAFRSVHLIDPILHGSSYWQEMTLLQENFIALQNRYRAEINAPAELFGYPLGLAWQKAFEALDLRQFEGKGRRASVYSSQVLPEHAAFQKHLESRSWDASLIKVADEFAWNDPIKMHMQCFARETLRSIVQQFTEL